MPWRRKRSDDDFGREIRSHLQLEVDRLVADGMGEDEARRCARRRFGNVASHTERFYESRRWLWVDQMRQDVRYTIRSLRRTPGFAAVAVLTLALGIGANAAVFNVVNAVLLRPLPYEQPDRLVDLFETTPAPDGSSVGPRRLPAVSFGELEAFRSRTQTLSHVSVAVPADMTLTGNRAPVRLGGARVSPAYFPLLGVAPLLGRRFDDLAERPGADAVVMLSYATWQREFGGRDDVIGRPIVLDGRPHLVVGVMGSDFRPHPDPSTLLWVPFVLRTDGPRSRGRAPLMARLTDGLAVASAEAEVDTILRALRAEVGTVGRASTATPALGPSILGGPTNRVPPSPPGPSARSPGPEAGPPPPPPPPPGAVAARPSRIELIGPQERLVSQIRPALLLLAAAAGLVLMIACTNVANLLLARAAAREREVAVRRALGAGRGRLVRQAVTESVALALAGGVAALAVAASVTELLRRLGRSLPRRDLGRGVDLPRLDEIGFDLTLIVYAVMVSLLVGVLVGLAPALRRPSVQHAGVLGAGPTSAVSGFAGFRRQRLHGLLVAAQICLALMLLVGGGLLGRSFVELTRVSPGYDATDVLTFEVLRPRTGSGPLRVFADAVAERLRSLSGVRAVGFSEELPLLQMRQVTALRRSPERSRDAPPPPGPPGAPQPPEWPLLHHVSQQFLPAMGTRVVAGRGFDDGDSAGRPQVMLVNEALARSGVLGPDPVGTLVYAEGDQPWEVIGIVEDVRQFGLRQDPSAAVYIDYRQARERGGVPWGPFFAIRTDGSRLLSTDNLRRVVQELDPQAAVTNVATMDQLLSNAVVGPRLYATLLALFALLGVSVAAVGLYGVVSYAVTRRTPELGIRVALGAGPGVVLALVLGQTARLVLAGLVAGLVGAALASRCLEALLFGIGPLDLLTFVAVALFVSVVALGAAWVPARRAIQVDPLLALRAD